MNSNQRRYQLIYVSSLFPCVGPLKLTKSNVPPASKYYIIFLAFFNIKHFILEKTEKKKLDHYIVTNFVVVTTCVKKWNE